MANRINLDAVCSHLVTRLTTLLTPAAPTGLGLARVQYGDLTYYPAEVLASLTAILPAIFIKPATWTTVRGPAIKSYTTTQRYRLVYVRKFETTEAVVQIKAQAGQLICETLIDEYNLPNLVISGTTVIMTRMPEGDLQQPEDLVVAVGVGANVTALSVEFEVELDANA